MYLIVDVGAHAADTYVELESRLAEPNLIDVILAWHGIASLILAQDAHCF